MNACRGFADVEMVLYNDTSTAHRSLDEVLACDADLQRAIFVLHWGPDVTRLARQLCQKGAQVVYFAHSTGWQVKLLHHVPIVCVSRHTQAYWGRLAPHNPIYHAPNIIDACFYPSDAHRDVDVLIQRRKSSSYLLEDLAPALCKDCNVEILDDWVVSLADVFRRSKVFLYDSREYWLDRGVSEGFGLPPLEAMACGCRVFSSVNDALADHIDPGFNGEQIGVISCEYDTAQILQTVSSYEVGSQGTMDWTRYREPDVSRRLQKIFQGVETVYDFVR